MPRGTTLGREFWRKHNVAYEGTRFKDMEIARTGLTEREAKTAVWTRSA